MSTNKHSSSAKDFHLSHSRIFIPNLPHKYIKILSLLTIQKTHYNIEEQLGSRGKIPGYELLGATYHHIKLTSDMIWTTLISTFSVNEIHNVVVKIYKPPAVSWPISLLSPLG